MASTLKEIVGRCESLFDDLNFTSVKEWKAAVTGRKVIGFMPVYVPREIIHAAGRNHGRRRSTGSHPGRRRGQARCATTRASC